MKLLKLFELTVDNELQQVQVTKFDDFSQKLCKTHLCRITINLASSFSLI